MTANTMRDRNQCYVVVRCPQNPQKVGEKFDGRILRLEDIERMLADGTIEEAEPMTAGEEAWYEAVNGLAPVIKTDWEKPDA